MFVPGILLLRVQLCSLVLDRSLELDSGILLSPFWVQLTLVLEALIVFIPFSYLCRVRSSLPTDLDQPS